MQNPTPTPGSRTVRCAFRGLLRSCLTITVTFAIAAAAQTDPDYSARLGEVFGVRASDGIGFDPTVETRDDVGAALRQAERDEHVRRIVDALHRDHETWIELSDRLEAAYRAEVDQAERDAEIRRTAGVFRVLSGIALAASELTSRWPESNARKSTDTGQDKVVKGRSQRLIIIDKGGSYDAIYTEEIFEYFDSQSDTDGFLSGLSSNLDIDSWSAATFGCGGQFGDACTPVPDAKVELLLESAEIRHVKPDPSGRPAPLLSALVDVVRQLPKPLKQAASWAIDAVPVLGDVKAAAELESARDLFTGETISRSLTAAGFLAARLPAGRLLVKIGARAAKSLGRPLRISMRKNRAVTVVGEKRAIDLPEQRYFHYTSPQGADGIADLGRIRAGEDGKVYATFASEGLLSPTAVQRKLQVDDIAKGKAVVGFNPPKGARVDNAWNPRLRRHEVVIQGDVPLNDGAWLLLRD